MKIKLIIFEWKDAALHGQRTMNYDDVGTLGLIKLISSGIVVKESDTEITLCMDYSPEEHTWRNTATYPKSCFKRIKYISLPKEWSYELD